MRRGTSPIHRVCLALLFILFFVTAPAKAAGAGTAEELNKKALPLLHQGRYDEAKALYEEALSLARRQKNVRQEAEALLGLGQVQSFKGAYPTAGSYFEKALGLFESLSDVTGLARALQSRGALYYHLGEPEKSLADYRKALTYFDQTGDLRGKAGALRAAAFTPTLTRDERNNYIREAFELAEKFADQRLQGLLLHDWGDHLVYEGQFDEAHQKLQRAADLLEKAGDKNAVARVFTSTGRLLRLHGQPEGAIEMYRRAMDIQRELGDRQGMVQSYNAMGVAYTVMENYRKAGECYQRGLDLARETGSERIIDFMKGALASNYMDLEQYARAAELLEQVISSGKSGALDYRHHGLAFAYFRLGRHHDALEAIAQAIAFRRKEVSGFLHQSLSLRAQILGKLHRTEEALADIREGMRLLEEQRARAIPADFLKLGYADSLQRNYSVAVALLVGAGRHQEALEIAEQGRARAFLDLLATREVALRKGGSDRVAALRDLNSSLRAEGSDPAEFLPRGPELMTRGAAGRPSPSSPLLEQWKSADFELRSFVAAEAFSMQQLAATASRLRSTILSYWVSEDATYIWVISPDGKLHAAVSGHSRQKLKEMIDTATAGLSGVADRGEEGEPFQAINATGPAIATRGGMTVQKNPSSKQAWRRLYDALIGPVRDELPKEPGSRLTIVPHGPLFRLSFAALTDETQRYLIERHELHYAPAGAVLEFTRRKLQRDSSTAGRYLLIADPVNTPPGEKGRLLPALPGARAEVEDAARLLRSSTLLEGTAATEARVRRELPSSRVIHFAVHGIVRDDSPLDSFLALGTTSSSPGEDGRLTAQDIYSLDLNADLVFLSACRSGRGKVTGDGVVGLTRSFVYAGTPSVVATLWDVPDEPTRRLIPEFYRAYLRRRKPGQALRAAQLRLLSDLRAGRVRISTPAGPVLLPEDPALWAAFVVLGEP